MPRLNTARNPNEVEAQRRKRLGQFFSGPRVAGLLAHLCDVAHVDAVLDPMAGSGDLLAACAPLLGKAAKLAGIEVDHELADGCASRLPQALMVTGSAFDAASILALPQTEWPCVIANPPYVRYQSLTRKASHGHVPNALDVRTALLGALTACSALEKEDRRLVEAIVTKYSGLSDLAVPAVVLCAALTAPNGVLGLVMPEAWLTRDYALPVHYLLARWFQIEAVVEDAHAAWFDNALVRTTLVVARRVARRESASDGTRRGYPYVRLSSAAMDGNSLVSRRYPDHACPDKAFADDVEIWRAKATREVSPFVEVTWVPAALQAQSISSALARVSWLQALEPMRASPASRDNQSDARLPHDLVAWLDRFGCSHDFARLEDLGVSVGQGLRTGANEFFYAPKVDESATHTQIGPLPLLSGRSIWIHSSFVLPALRRQAELPETFSVSAADARSVVLNLADSALPEDVERMERTDESLKVIEPALAELVRAAACANFGTSETPRRIWELTAVAPNCRPAGRAGRKKSWFELPKFVDRHKPQVFIPRVNNGLPRAFLNDDRSMLVDANFSALWLKAEAQIDALALLALMNSTWMQTVMELSASLLGGGAAKLEASHLRSVPVPRRLSEIGGALSRHGKRLARARRQDAARILQAIDSEVLSILVADQKRKLAREDLQQIAQRAQQRRALRPKSTNS